jgi:branched-chain amino acid aminotransferase
MEAQRECVRANKLESCYLRPLVFYGSEKMGVSPGGLRRARGDRAWPWGAYLGEDGLKKGIRVKTSSYARHHVNVTMARAKVATTYANSILANLEATQHGYDEGLLLDTDGFVAEGAGENIFIVKDGRVYTPELTTALDGITWRSVQSICADLGIVVEKTRLTRDDIYICDEAFFTGTAGRGDADPRARPARDWHRLARPRDRAHPVGVLRHRERPQPQVPPLAHPRRRDPECRCRPS